MNRNTPRASAQTSGEQDKYWVSKTRFQMEMTMSEPVWYLAGPMSGIAQHNIPLFDRVTSELREAGFNVVSPAELDDEAVREAALDDPTGTVTTCLGMTWADFLARDVKLIADDVNGIIFLDGWERSKGARLEAFIGIICGHDFARYTRRGQIERMSKHTVLTKISRQTYEDLRRG
jgi:hypothetical protein